MSLSGGELIVWKRNVVVADGKRYVLRAPPKINAQFFDDLIVRCPRALGIRPDGSMVLPRLTAESTEEPLQVLGDALNAGKSELGRQIIKSASAAIIALLIGIVRLYLGIRFQIAHPNGPVGTGWAIWGFVFGVTAVLLAVRTTFLWVRRRRILQVITGIVQKGELDPQTLARAVAPVASRALLTTTGAPFPPREISFAVAMIVILSLCLMCIPWFGFAISLTAFLVTFRKKSWARTVSIIALTFSTLFTAYITILLMMAKK